jgi:hypothetical protein
MVFLICGRNKIGTGTPTLLGAVFSEMPDGYSRFDQ